MVVKISRSQIMVAAFSTAALGVVALGASGCARGGLGEADFSMKPVEVEMAGGQAALPSSLLTRRHLSNFKLCAQRGYEADRSELRGQRMEVHFTLGSQGAARNVKVETPAFAQTVFAQCVVRILHWVRFPDQQSGQTRSIRMWLVLDDERPFVGELHADRRSPF